MAEKQLGSAPSAATDIATKGYVDSRRTVQTVTAATTLSANGDYIVFLSGTGAAPTLPTAANNTSKYTVKNNSGADKTILTTSSQTIEGMANLVLPAGYSVDIVSDGTSAWFVV
jgi:hypothetical protein